VAAFGISGIQWDLIQTVVISWFLSPLLAGLVAFLLYKLLSLVVTRYVSVDRFMPPLLVITLCYSAYAFGTNDIANATGVYFTVASMVMGNAPEQYVVFLLAAFGSIGLTIGGFWLGPKVIETVAFKITRLSLISATAAETSNAVVVHLFTVIPYMMFGYGMPISTSLASIGALVGVGFASYGSSGINKKTIMVLSAGWVATIFVTAFFTYVFYTILFPYTGSIINPNP
jgi:PiT family inorganic phosphate transporter